MASVSLKEKIKDYLMKNKRKTEISQQEEKQEEKVKQIDSKYYDIFDLYFYVVRGTENRPQIAYAYQKGDHYFDCMTGDFLPNPSIINKCFDFDAEKMKTLNYTNVDGVCFVEESQANYLNNKIKFYYGREKKCSGDKIYHYFNPEDIKSYDENVKTSSFGLQINLVIYYTSKGDVNVQPKLCLSVNDLKKSEETINGQLETEYREIDTLIERRRLNELKKQKEEDDYKKLTKKIKERVV